MKKSKKKKVETPEEVKNIPEVKETEEKQPEPKKSNLKRNLLIAGGIVGAALMTAVGITSARRDREDTLAALALSQSEDDEEDENESEDNSEDESSDE